MSHDVPTIHAAQRERVGSRYAKRLRSTGRLPAVIYGHGSEPLAVHVDEHTTMGVLKKGIHVFNLEIEGKGTETCLVKDLQFGYLGDNVIHLDLTRVNLEEEVEVTVAIDFYGEPEAAKKAGIVVVHEMSDLSIRCKVRDIPDHIRVDLSGMTADTFTAGEVTLPEGLALAGDASALVARIQILKVADTAETTASGEGEAAASE